jgi:hypothetical protein
VEILWTRDRSVAETSTWQHTTFIKETFACPRRDSNPQFQQASGHWDLFHLITSHLQIQLVHCCQPLEYVLFFTGRHKLNYAVYCNVYNKMWGRIRGYRQTDIFFGKNMHINSLNLYRVKAYLKVIENINVNCEVTTLRSVVVTILAARFNTKMFQFLPVSVCLSFLHNSNNNPLFTYDLLTQH